MNNTTPSQEYEYDENFNFKVLSNPLGINLDDETKIWKKSAQTYPQNFSKTPSTPSSMNTSYLNKSSYLRQASTAPKNIQYSLLLSSLKDKEVSLLLSLFIFIECLFMGIFLHINHFSWSTFLEKYHFLSLAGLIALHCGIFFLITQRLTKKFQFKIPE